MTLILISAMTRQRVIGKDNALPWSIPDEYDHFLRLVRGHPVIMGRTSYQIFGPDLPGSRLIVVSTARHFYPRFSQSGAVGSRAGAVPRRCGLSVLPVSSGSASLSTP